ncbi:uncharacterized protein LOC110920908 [Helianthus annuus]|uniref:uncharacterized protein LOC110920908 n=1 Tax=Helianthus annuus TaxID=4232 RepID=UPI000B8F69BE|nr:uncharacterized protein LOC110920908 [Helianthus annuus]
MAVPSSIHCWLESVISEILGYRGFPLTKDDGIHGLIGRDLCRSMGACIFEASSTISTFHSSMYTRDYIQDDVVVVIKKISNMHFDQDLEEGALKILFFISKSMKAPKRIIQIWFPEDVHPPKWAIERIEKHATKKGFESFIPAQDSSLRYAPYRGKRLYFRRTLNKDDEEDDAKAKATKKGFESFIPAQDSSLRYAPYRGKRLYFRRTLNKDDEEDDAKAKATKKGFESFIPAQDSSLRYVPYRGKRLYFRRTLNKDDEEDDAKAKAKAKATEYEVRDDDEEDDATNGA